MNHHNRERQELAKDLRAAEDSLFNCLSQTPPPSKNEAMIPETQQIQNLEKSIQKMSIFDKIPDFQIDESMESRIVNLKLTQFSHRRKDDLFKRFKQQQEKEYYSRMNQFKTTSQMGAPQRFKPSRNQFHLRNEQQGRVETFPFRSEDMEKLRPDTDLNDTIIANYLKLLEFVFLPSALDQKVFIFSSFFMAKLIPDYLKEEVIAGKDPNLLTLGVAKKVRDNYQNVRRWTKKIDIFQRDFIVIPVNAFGHWFCLLVLHPGRLLTAGQGKPEIIYCDSMMEKRGFIVETVRQYLQMQLQEKKNVKMEFSEDNFPCYQLLLPRQTNCHDCGLYMLAYIEELLYNPRQLQNLSSIPNRRKLTLFPRALIHTFRDRLRRLYQSLLNAESEEEKNEILVSYKGERERLINETDGFDFDKISEKECRKYEKMNVVMFGGVSEQQRSFACEIKFYIDPDINFYQKDK